MNCQDVRGKLKAFLDEDVEAAEKAAIQEHLAGCADCSRAARQLTRLPGLLQAWKDSDPPRDLHERLHSRMESRESWWKRVATPSFAGKAVLRFAEIAAVIVVTLVVSRHFQKPTPATQEDDLATINFYMTEHEVAVMQAASEESAARPGARVTIDRDDILYYEFIDDYRRISRPGVILRGSSSSRASESETPDSGIPDAKALTLPQARRAVSFDPVAPARIHPGYILDSVTKVSGRESLHLLYTNGIDTFSVFEQALDGEAGLAARDFREYAVFRSSIPVPGSGNQAGTTILAWKNSHISFVLIGRADMSQLMAIAQAFSDAGTSVNEFGE